LKIVRRAGWEDGKFPSENDSGKSANDIEGY